MSALVYKSPPPHRDHVQDKYLRSGRIIYHHFFHAFTIHLHIFKLPLLLCNSQQLGSQQAI
uniref:Uncharacterized protein n=1 Tax=Arion vulgaris TaxID=1028688 RepID=A0A0B6XXR4_9EUPU